MNSIFKASSSYRMQPRKPMVISLCICVTSLLFITSGILLLCTISLVYDAIIESNLVLRPGSSAFNIWIKNPVPLDLKLFLFNWTNPKDIHNHTSIKPKFQLIGPYIYDETKEKSNLTWNSNNTVTFRLLKRWWFNQSKSNGTLTDLVTSINPIAFAAAYATRNYHLVMKKGFSFTLNTLVNSIEITRPVGQVLFDGYDDPLLSLASKLPFMSKSSMPFSDKFGWFYGRNDSTEYEGIFNMDTSIERLGVLNEWKHSNHTPYYPRPCGEFQEASAGDFFPRKLTKDRIVKLFSPDLCRFMDLEFEKEVVINGLVGYKYAAGERFLDNGTKYPENKCFCDGDCMPSGALNVSNCRHGSPAFVSLPNFYKGDPYYLSDIEGVHPKAETSDLYMIFEPKTGIPLEVVARLQLNLRIQPIPSITLYNDLPTVFFPILYFEQKVTIPEDMTFSIKLLVNFEVICIAIGTILIGIGILVMICLWYKICTTNIFGKKSKKLQECFDVKEELPLNQR